jgi:energy-coupling factor transporter transmembrane protein EcfT
MATTTTNRRALHPAVSILCWLIFALTVEWANGFALVLFALSLAMIFFVQHDAFTAFLRLLKRSRWLFLSLALLYAWTINGAWIWPELRGFSPTREGLEMGGQRIARLILLLAALALLLKKLSRDDLVYGLYLLAWPFAKRGFDRRAFAVRLALAMEWAGTEKPSNRSGILDALQSALIQTESGSQEIRFESRAFAWADGLALAAMLAVLGASL